MPVRSLGTLSSVSDWARPKKLKRSLGDWLVLTSADIAGIGGMSTIGVIVTAAATTKAIFHMTRWRLTKLPFGPDRLLAREATALGRCFTN